MEAIEHSRHYRRKDGQESTSQQERYGDTAPTRGRWIELSNRRMAGDDNSWR
jgi:hypothetical protein